MAEGSEEQKRLQIAVWKVVDRICKEESSKLDLPISKEYIVTLATLVYKQMETFSLDIEAFTKHAHRSTINVDDVLLCARRNDDLYNILTEKSTEINTSRKAKKRQA